MTRPIVRNPWIPGLSLVLALIGVVGVAVAQSPAPTEAELRAMLETLDERQRNVGDYKSSVYIEQKEKGKADKVFEAVVYRRDAADKFMLLFTRPKAEAGKGYLRIDKNLFLYDPAVGKWERRTERERIAGTDTRRQDLDESRLAEDYKPSYVGLEKLGAFTVHHLKLDARAGVDVPYPVIQLWIDQQTGNVLKQQDVALSGKLMRTSYFPTWLKKNSPSKGGDIYYPKEIRIFDEVEKGKNTVIVTREVALDNLPDNIFTKAWLESQSR